MTDGPFGETKEVIGGHWFIRADSLEEAAKLVEDSPCLPLGQALRILFDYDCQVRGQFAL